MKKKPKFDLKSKKLKGARKAFTVGQHPAAPMHKGNPKAAKLEQAMAMLKEMHDGFMNFMEAPESGYGVRGKRYDWEKKADCFLKGIKFAPDKDVPPPVFEMPEAYDNPVKARGKGEKRTIHRDLF